METDTEEHVAQLCLEFSPWSTSHLSSEPLCYGFKALPAIPKQPNNYTARAWLGGSGQGSVLSDIEGDEKNGQLGSAACVNLVETERRRSLRVKDALPQRRRGLGSCPLGVLVWLMDDQ
ncbi:hypothetical protein AOLI_G00190250 [Acnodon oligacanthus]